MESIRSIQEIVDEHKGEMPTGVVTVVMEACQKAYDSQPKLYKLTWTMVESHAHVVEVQHEPDFARVQLAHKTQTFIALSSGESEFYAALKASAEGLGIKSIANDLGLGGHG